MSSHLQVLWMRVTPKGPESKPYHRAGKVVLRQAEIHHALRVLELRLPSGQLRQSLWSKRTGMKDGKESACCLFLLIT